jgi:hypothetical protein
VFEAKGAFSRITGDQEAISTLQQNPVHYYQRPDADHLGLEPDATSLTGHAGTLRVARYGNSKWRWGNQARWASPGFDLNDVGFLRQADFIVNVANLGYFETDPRGPFRQWHLNVKREDAFDYGGMRTDAATGVEASGMFHNKWTIGGFLRAIGEPTSTRLLRGGPSMKTSGFWGAGVEARTDASRRVVAAASFAHHFGAEADTQALQTQASLRWRVTRRLVLQTIGTYLNNLDDLQYTDTAESSGGPRYVLGRIDQDTVGATFRADLQITPDLTVQYYGSPFVSNGRYGQFKRVTDPHAGAYDDRFVRLEGDALAYDAASNTYSVAEGGTTYSFANPDFSFREFRSNLVTRWEFKPGSAMYVVWSQGRTSSVDKWDDSISHSFDQLWATPASNVFLVKFSYWLSL